jgi:hypothetical protein
MKAAAPARKCVPAWLDGWHHQRRRGGTERRAFRLGSKAMASTRGKERVGEERRGGLPARKKRK